jgi:acetyltransferase-like isoleucine patch superfamily enzyme
MDYIKRVLIKIYQVVTRAKIPPFLIESNTLISAGKMNYHNGNFKIACNKNDVKIGNYCAFGNNISIITESHDYNFPAIQYVFHRKFFGKEHPGTFINPPNKERRKGAVTIGNDVWIGNDVTIMSGTTIGDGAIIGNKALVTKDVSPYSVWGGVPAKCLKMRFGEEKIKFLLEIKWWNWSEEKIKKNESFFFMNINKESIETLRKSIIE